MRKPTIQEYRLAAWSRLREEKVEKARACFEMAFDLENRGYYERADRCRREGDEYRNEAFGMVSALYCLGYTENDVFEAKKEIQNYISGEG